MKKLTNRDWVTIFYVTLWILGDIVTYIIAKGPEGPAYFTKGMIIIFLPILYLSHKNNKFKKWLDK